jgi:hypothetical protein
MNEAPKALRSLYGASDRQKATAKSHIGPGDRPQEIYTPQCIVDAVLRVWGHVAFDPCWGPSSIVPSQTHAYVPVRYRFNAKGEAKPYYEAMEGDVDGLTVPWPSCTYANPPYVHLKAWLQKAVEEASYGTEIIVLAPHRTQRKWYRSAKRAARAVCELDPLTFEGYKASFPAALAVLYYGDCPHLFEAAFAELGDCV